VRPVAEEDLVMAERRFTLAARTGAAFALRKGERLRVINSHGTQVVDTWAFASAGAFASPGAFTSPETFASASEYLSLEHCREVLQKLFFETGDLLLTNLYQPILTIVRDTSPGRHDTLIAACSRLMYERAGRGHDHANCADNLAAALAAHGLRPVVTPSPWNLFMQAPVEPGGHIDYVRPLSKPGDYVELRAEMDCLLAFSACPDDVYPTNGGDGTPRDVEIHLI
jgi:uncharacterized protein YcgI (DUF1989 family)